MKNKNILTVKYNNQLVGTLALHKRFLVAFEYDKEWIQNGFSISPLSLPLEKKVFIPKLDPFDGLFGVFSDSLPDGWGRLLVDRVLSQNGINPETVTQLDRLAIVGKSGMGALTYEPAEPLNERVDSYDLDVLAEECRLILESDSTEGLDTLFTLGGSSGGARPKILTEINNENWIIKFPSSEDSKNIGKQEYDYSVCAKACGIEMEETQLFPSSLNQGYFGTKRFDRTHTGDRIHMVSVSGLLETSHRLPNLDYTTLMKLTLNLTHNYNEVEKLYRIMCFNVFAHNRDDHSKNFSYIYSSTDKRWYLSPAYDLTYSYSIGGEHATTVNGNGNSPGEKELLSVAKLVGIQSTKAKHILQEVQAKVYDHLGQYISI